MTNAEVIAGFFGISREWALPICVGIMSGCFSAAAYRFGLWVGRGRP